MESPKFLDLTTKKKKYHHLHIPLHYVPLCQNIHPENDFRRNRMKNKTIDHSALLFFSKPEVKVIIPNNRSKPFSLDIINKKKTREIILFYNLNAKLKLQRQRKNEQDEWTKKQHAKNSFSLIPTNFQQELLKEQNHKRLKTMAENEMLKISSNKKVLTETLELENLTKNPTLLTNNGYVSYFKTEEEELANKLQVQQKERKIIERTGIKIYGQDKHNQDIIKHLLQITTKKKLEKKNSKKNKKKINQTILSKVNENNKIPLKINSNETLLKENEKVITNVMKLWKYNKLTDDFEFNEGEEDVEKNTKFFDKKFLENYLNIEKKGSYETALRNLEFYRQSFKENQKQLRENDAISHLYYKQAIKTDSEIEIFYENDKKFSKFNENFKLNKEISGFELDEEIGSLQMLTVNRKNSEKNNRVLKSVHDSLHNVKQFDEKKDKCYFMRLAETIKGICKKEHSNHRKLLKTLKTNYRIIENTQKT